MFTGLIEKICAVKGVRRDTDSMLLIIDLGELASESKTGDSIAVNGVCLTISRLEGSFASFELSAETLSKSTLCNLQPSSEINVERAMRPNDRFGGFAPPLPGLLRSYLPQDSSHLPPAESPRDQNLSRAADVGVDTDGWFDRSIPDDEPRRQLVLHRRPNGAAVQQVRHLQRFRPVSHAGDSQYHPSRRVWDWAGRRR